MKANMLHDFKEGLAYTFGSQPIRSILLLLALTSFMGVPYAVLMPAFARDILHGGPHTLGFLMSATGAGALLGAVYLASRRSIIGLGKIIPITAGIFGMGLIGFSLSRILWLSLLLMFIAGFGIMVQVASSNTLLQTIVDDNMRGRVMSFFAVSFMGMAPFGSLLAGSLAGMMGVANTLMLGGICCVIGATVYARKGYAFLSPPHKPF
jgi:MFS family permease